MSTIIATSIGSAALTYEVIAIFGYLTFGNNVGSNIIQNYPSTSLFVAFGQLAIVILVLFSYPLQVQPCRNCLHGVFGQKLTIAKKVDEEGEADEELESRSIPKDMTLLKHSLLTALIVAPGYLIAYFVDDLRVVLAFVGATGSTTISFILPGLLFWRLFRDQAQQGGGRRVKWLRTGALMLIVYGACILVFCLSYNIYAIVSGTGVSH